MIKISNFLKLLGIFTSINTPSPLSTSSPSTSLRRTWNRINLIHCFHNHVASLWIHHHCLQHVLELIRPVVDPGVVPGVPGHHPRLQEWTQFQIG